MDEKEQALNNALREYVMMLYADGRETGVEPETIEPEESELTEEELKKIGRTFRRTKIIAWMAIIFAAIAIGFGLGTSFAFAIASIDESGMVKMCVLMLLLALFGGIVFLTGWNTILLVQTGETELSKKELCGE